MQVRFVPCISLCLYILYLFVYLSVSLSVCLFVYLSVNFFSLLFIFCHLKTWKCTQIAFIHIDHKNQRQTDRQTDKLTDKWTNRVYLFDILFIMIINTPKLYCKVIDIKIEWLGIFVPPPGLAKSIFIDACKKH